MTWFRCLKCRKTNKYNTGVLAQEYWGKNLEIPCLLCGQSTGYIVHQFNGFLVQVGLDDGYTEAERIENWNRFGARISETSLIGGTLIKIYPAHIRDKRECFPAQLFTEWYLWKFSLIEAGKRQRGQIKPIKPEFYRQAYLF